MGEGDSYDKKIKYQGTLMKTYTENKGHVRLMNISIRFYKPYKPTSYQNTYYQ